MNLNTYTTAARARSLSTHAPHARAPNRLIAPQLRAFWRSGDGKIMKDLSGMPSCSRFES